MSVAFQLVPLAAAISLVYSASRYEDPRTIGRCAVQIFLQIVIGLGIFLAGLFVLSWRL